MFWFAYLGVLVAIIGFAKRDVVVVDERSHAGGRDTVCAQGRFRCTQPTQDGNWYLTVALVCAFNIWHLVFGIWHLAFGIWCVEDVYSLLHLCAVLQRRLRDPIAIGRQSKELRRLGVQHLPTQTSTKSDLFSDWHLQSHLHFHIGIGIGIGIVICT